MSKTEKELRNYLNLLEITEKQIEDFLSKKEIQLYCLLRDNLTYSSLLELEAIIKDVLNNLTDLNHVDFSRFINLNTKKLKKVNDIFDLQLLNKKEILLALSTIILTKPKNLVMNFYNEI